MNINLQPKPEFDLQPNANKGIVSKDIYFVKKVFEKINPYFFPAHLIRKWRPKAELIYSTVDDETTIQYECDFNREIQNCFVEDYAEEVFLRSPPPCFVILGKLGSNIDKLGQKLAEEYGSVLIKVDNIVNEVMATKTETAKFLKKLLRLGISLTLNFILALMSYMAHTAEARHRGYVLTGIPSIPLLSDLSAEQQLNYLFSWENKPTVFIHVLFKDEDLVNTRTCLRYEINNLLEKKKCISIWEQFNFCMSNASDTDNDDNDANGDKNNEDDGNNDDAKNYGDKNDSSKYFQALNKTFKKVEENLNVSSSRPSVKLPRDEESNVWYALELFEEKIKPVIDLLRSRIDPQYFITIDSRIKNDFEIVKARLNLLPIWKVPLPIPFNSVEENNIIMNDKIEEEIKQRVIGKENETDIDLPEINHIKHNEKSSQISFLSFFAQKTLSPKYRWELSHYNYICPVSLRAGEIIEGKSNFAVIFMKYIYFLCNKNCMKEFLKNPRPYVLPIRPKPPSRFIVIGYPSSGKTSLAKSLAEEFSVPLIDLNVIMYEDLKKKKEIYQQYCKQRAECAEIIRLTAQAWKDWRIEEEQRISLIEEWIEYIRIILSQRIKQFYGQQSEKNITEIKSGENTEEIINTNNNAQKGEISESGENLALEVRGFSIPLETSNNESTNIEQVFHHYSTPSAKIIRAMKNEDFDFDKNGFEVEANIFFSTLWNSFSSHQTTQTDMEKVIKEHLYEESEEENEEEKSAKSIPEDKFYASNLTVNWCNLLPPQSLSSLILKKKIPCTIKERKKSFRILLKAASKAYWEPSPLKLEFAKWRLPCFMDIPLCEIFYDNPLLLYKYCPEWLKERPLTPEIVDVNHPAVAEAGRRAVNIAKTVTLKHTLSEIGILLSDTIEKAEKDGMRISGEVISPGGWVIDNMDLNMEIWCTLFKRNVLPNYVYILFDSEPRFSNIINNWYEMQYKSTILKYLYPQLEKNYSEEEEEEEEKLVDMDTHTVESSFDLLDFEKTDNAKDKLDVSLGEKTVHPDIKNLLLQSCILTEEGEKEIDRIFSHIKKGSNNIKVKPRTPLDAFSYSLIHKRSTTKQDNDDPSCYFDDTAVTILSFLDSSTHTFYSEGEADYSTHYSPLGAQLEIFTDPIVQYLDKRITSNKKNDSVKNQKSYESLLQFFKDLLTLNEKLNKIKEWLNSLNQIIQVKEIDIAGKNLSKIFSEIIKDLYQPFIKKPRELYSLEIEELKKILDAENEETQKQIEKEGLKGEFGRNLYGDDDTRIYGESGPYCIVNLERNILLKGNFEYILRYYGKLYFFCSQECKSKFIENPEKFAPYYSPIRCLPPLRIYMVGPIGSGKTSLAFPLSDQCNLHYHDFIEFLIKRVTPHYLPRPQKITALSHKFLKGNTHNEAAKLALEDFESAPESRRQYWLNTAPWYLDIGDNYPEVLENLKGLKDKRLNVENLNLSYECLDDDNDSVVHNALLSNMALIPSHSTFLNISSHGQVINNYIHHGTDLNEFIYDRSMGICWTKPPHCLEGIVIENFPMRYCDIPIIVNNHWIPDIVIEVKLSVEMVIERNLDKLMKLWEEKLREEIKEEQFLEDTILNIHKTAAVFRRAQLFQEKRPSLKAMSFSKNILEQTQQDLGGGGGGGGRRRRLSIGAEKKQKDEKSMSVIRHRLSRVSAHALHRDEEIDSILDTEFPPLKFKPIFQTIQEGKTEIIQDILENYQKDIDELNNIKAEMKKMKVRWLEVDNSKNLKHNLDFIYEKIHFLKSRLNQKGEFAFSVSPEMAEKLLSQGFYFLSKFGRLCPVQVYRKKNPINMYRPLRSRDKIFPIAYRNYIYFIAGENERWKFLENPLKYIFQEPSHPNIPLRIAVIGPPKSGKSNLCQRLGLMFNLKVITMGSAIRFVLEETSHNSLKKVIKNYLKNGCFLPLSLKIEALLLSLNDPACITQGFVFDGIPFQAALAQSLAEKKKLPFVIISLVAQANFGRKNREKLDLSAYRLPYKQKVNLNTKYNEWNETYQRFAEWNKNTYNNLYEIDANANILDIFYKAYDIIKTSYFNILNYVEYCIKDKPISLQYLCITPQEFDLRKSAFQRNCLVCWVEKQRLITCDNVSNLGLFQYLNHFYWICQDHTKYFLKNPKLYVPPRSLPWPTELPRMYSKKEYETTIPEPIIHGFGRCPVTCSDFPDSLDWEGLWDYSAFYCNKVYLCKNKEMLTRFLAQPWRYSSVDTIFEKNRGVEKSNAVKQLGPPQLTSLPPIGFLEQTVAQAINNALQIVGNLRPVYPNLSPKCTACIFLALYLKVHNTKTYKPTLEKEYLDFMILNCKTYMYEKSFARKRMVSHSSDFYKDLVSSIESEGSESKSSSTQELEVEEDLKINSHWQDFKDQADKKLWSAKQQSTKFQEMKLIQEKKLEFIPETPKYNVVLRIHVPSLRGSPFPPIFNCYNYLYSRKPNLKLFGKFNINSLHQPLPILDSPFPQSFVFNPNKEFALKLYVSKKTKTPSNTNVWEGKRTFSGLTVEDAESIEQKDREYFVERYIPRFQIMDYTNFENSTIPKVIEEEPIFLQPQLEYFNTLLFSHFFQISHVLRCYEWNQCIHHLEYSYLLDKNLALCDAQSQFFRVPKVTESEKSRRSILSYQQTMEAATPFLFSNQNEAPEIAAQEVKNDTSLVNFIQSIILEKMNQMFVRLSSMELSYDSYEMTVQATESDTAIKKTVYVKEILPFPPLIWDLISRPYYCYLAVPLLFNFPILDHIAHERHVSLLDGIREPNDNFSFVRYPTWVNHKSRFCHNSCDTARQKKLMQSIAGKVKLMYDFFDLQWTSLLTYPFSLAYINNSKNDFFAAKDIDEIS